LLDTYDAQSRQWQHTSVCVREPAQGPGEDSVLGSRRFAVWAKRLEEGTYAMPFGEDEHRREITAQELARC